MEFPSSFFEDEVREGFYISGIVKRGWAAQMEVLEEVAKVCKKHNIKWFADCGTLLGAVRHGGYVPWDDDLDICMLRPDYMKFMAVAQKELPKSYVLLHVYNEGNDYYEHMMRVATGRSLCFDKEYLDKYHECPYATGIDIFPLDYVADNEEEEDERKLLLKLMLALEDNLAEDNSNVSQYEDAIKQIEEICNVKFDRSKNMKEQAFRFSDEIFALYSDIGGKHVALMPYWINFDNHLYPAEYFDKSIMMPFELMEVPVPRAYDGVLKIEYGDYMKVYKGGGVHEYPCYEKQEKHLIKIAPDYPFKYKFDEKDLLNEERKNNTRPRKSIIEMLNLMSEAHEAVIATIILKQYEQTSQLLIACQNTAIQIGTLIENVYGDNTDTIKILEEYCEIIFQISQLLEEAQNTGEMGLSANDIAGYLKEIFVAINESIEQNIPDKREILFITVRANEWNAIEGEWQKAIADEKNDVYVMPVPYFERTALGSPGKEHYERDMFPEYVETIDYKEYNLELRHPDIIYIQEPYDQCNYTTSILPTYYSKNLKAHTEKLIYIPWFTVDEISEGGEKARKVMQYYCTVPGLVHSDVVVVQSEQTKEDYIKCLCEFAGEHTKSVWEEKIVVESIDNKELKKINTRRLGKEAAFSELPDEWKELIKKADGGFKKIILYNTTVAAFTQYGEAVFDKAERSFEIFKEYRDDIVVIWKTHPMLRSLAANTNSRLIHKYDRIVRQFKESKIGIFDTEKRADELISLCDAYYGDADVIAHKCNVTGVPVMLQNVEL